MWPHRLLRLVEYLLLLLWPTASSASRRAALSYKPIAMRAILRASEEGS